LKIKKIKLKNWKNLRQQKALFFKNKSCRFARFFLSLSMETKKKAGVLAVAVTNPIEKKEPNFKNAITHIDDAKNEDVKPKGLNLDETIKVIEDLFQKKRHRDRLDTYVNYLEAFEIKATAEDLDPKSSYYYGCKLVITDDEKANFELKNPTIIKEVIEYLKKRLGAKLAEIESELVLPTL